MKIAYLHGLESTINQKDPKIIFLNKSFDEVYTPSINYRDASIFDKLYRDIKSLNPDLIVGSSMGGYVSYLIGRKLSIPVLLFNPALVGRSFDPVVNDSNLKNTKIEIKFGSRDSVINGKEVRSYLKDNKVSFSHTEYNGGHRVPEDVFINSIKDTLQMNEIHTQMKYVKLFEEFINENNTLETTTVNLSMFNKKGAITETIKASEAYDTMNAVQTILDGKRELAFISTMDNPIYAPNNKSEIEAMNYGLENGLKSIEVKNKKNGKAWILYKTDKKMAQKLADYATEHEGYLSDSTPEEARYVGNLLGYDKKDIEDFVKRVYKK